MKRLAPRSVPVLAGVLGLLRSGLAPSIDVGERAGVPADTAGPPPGRLRGAQSWAQAKLHSGLFRKYAALLVSLVGGALIINGGIESYYSYYDHRAAAVAVQREKAQGAARVIEQFVREIESQLGWTTHTGFLPADLEQRRFDFLRLLRQAPAITEVSFIDASGKEQLKVSRLAMDSVGSGIDFSADPKFREAKEKRRYLSTVYFRKDSEPYLTLSVAGPMRNAGVTIAEVNLKFIWDVISRIKVGTAGVAYVVDGRGLLIAHPDIGLVLRKTDLSHLTHVAAARAPDSDNDLSPLSNDLTGREVLTAFASIDSLGWLVFVDLPVGEAFRPLYASLLRSGGVLLLGLLLAGLAGLWLAQRMVVPIRALAAGATRIGAGDLDHRIELATGDEVETLARGFNDMGARLKESYATLESKVEQRTRELSEALAHQTATSSVLNVISRSPSQLQPVLDAIVETAARLCQADYAFIFRRENDAFHLAAVSNGEADFVDYLRSNPIPQGRGSTTGRAALERRTVHIPDVLADADYDRIEQARRGNYRTNLGVPLLRNGEPIAVITLVRSTVQPFTDKQIELVTTFADQALIAIENTRLFEEVQERTRQMEEALEYQTATAEVLNVISRSPTQLEPVLDAIVATAAKLCDAEFAIVFKEQGGAYHIAASNNAEAEFVRYAAEHPIRPDRGSLIGRTALERRPVHLPDCLADPEFTYFEYQRIGKYRSMLGVPLLREGVPIGVIGLMRTTVEPFTGKQIELVTTFADQALIAIENTRLFEEVKARTRELSELLKQQTATADVLKVISRSTFDLDAVLDALVHSAAVLCEAESAVVYRYSQNQYSMAAAHSFEPDFRTFLQQHPIVPGPGTAIGRMHLERRTIQISDVLADPDYQYAAAQSVGRYRAVLAVPLLREGQPIGGFGLLRSSPRPFSPKQIELIETFADQAVIAIENARLFEAEQKRTRELQESLEYQTATAEVLNVISRSPTQLQPVLDAIVQTAAALCASDYAFITRVADGRCHLAAANRMDSEHVQYLARNPVPVDRGTVTGRVALAKAAIHVHDILADPEFERPDWQAVGRQRTVLGVPLLRQGALIGVMILARTTVEPFTPRQIELVTTFADQAVIAIENTRLFEEVQARTKQLQEALDYQTASSEVLSAISRSPTAVQPVFDTIVASAARLCEALFSNVQLFDGRHLHVVATHNYSSEALVHFERLYPMAPNRSQLAGRAVLSRSAVHVPDVLADPEYLHEFAEAAGFRSMLSVPMLREGRAVGVITVAKEHPVPFTSQQVELLKTFADQAVIAIENTRLFEEVQARTRELEQALQQQTATAEVLKTISRSTFDLQVVLDTLTRSAAQLCEAEMSGIVRPKGDAYYWASSYGFEPEFSAFVTNYPIAPGRETGVGRVLLEGRTVHIPDVLADPDYAFHEGRRLGGFRTLLAVPLLREGTPIGVIVVTRRTVQPFTDKQIELVATFADQAVIAIENARLFDEVQSRTRELTEALHQQTATADVLKTISRSTFDLEKVLDVLVETAVRLCEADGGTITRQIGGEFVRAGTFGFSDAFRDVVKGAPVIPDRGTVSGRALLEARTVRILDARADPDYTWNEAKELGEIRSALAVPLMREGTPIGVLSLTRRVVRPFTDKQAELAATFADQAVIAIENVRLFEEVQARTRELEQALQQQTATAEVLKTISRSTFDLDTVFDTLLESATRLCNGHMSWIFQRDGEILKWAASYGHTPEVHARIQGYFKSLQVPVDRGSVVGRAAFEKAVVNIPDVLADAEYKWGEAQKIGGYRAALGAPLLREGKVVGVLFVAKTVPEPFTDKHIELVKTFADQAVIAIENVRLFEEVQARTRELSEALEFQTATSEVLQVISRSPSELQPVLDAIVRTAARLCDAYDSIAMLRKGDWLEIAAHHGAIPVDFKGWRVNDGWVTGRAVTHGRPIHVEDLAAHPDEFPDGHAMASRLGHRTILAVPLMRGKEAIGALTIRRLEVRPFSDKQVSLLQTFADQAVIAIQNVRLFEEVQARTRELARSLDELKALSEVGQAISSTLDLNAVLDAILMHACRLADSGGGAIYVFDEARGTFELEAAYNMSQQFIEAVRQHPIHRGESLVGQCAERREAVQVEDLRKAPPHPLFAMHLKADVQALLAVPLLHQTKVIGALVVRRKRAGAFSDEIVSLLQSFASQSAIAIQNARLFREIEDKSHQLELASQHKSQFLANMSHELRTPLNAILGYAELMQDGVYGELSDKVKAVLERVQSNGKHLLGLINDVLDLSKIEAGQLVLRLEDYSMGQIVETIATSTGSLAAEKKIGLKVEVAPGLPLGFGDERRIAQVLLNLVGNAIKFTDEGEVCVSVRADGDRFVVCVADTGPGIAPADQQRIFEEFHQVDSSNTKKKGGTGLGLAIARRIVEMHGGRLWVDSEPGKGARFYVDLPVRAAQEGRAA